MSSKAKQTGNALYHGLEVDGQLKNYNKWIIENIREAFGKNILEIGCGMGTMIDLAAARGRKITGADIDSGFITHAKKKYAGNPDIKIIKADMEGLSRKFKRRPFDTVMMINTLEHIRDDNRALKVIYGLLTGRGKLAVFVPAFQSIYGQLDKNVGHYRRYDRPGLRKLLEKNNFLVEKLYYMNIIGFFGWFFNSKFLKRGYTPEFQSAVFDNFLVPVESAVERIIKPPFGQSLVAIASKKIRDKKS